MSKVLLSSFHHVSLLRKDRDVTSSSLDSCSDCEGTSWKRIVSNGRNVVVRCGCSVADPHESIMANSGVPSRYLECALDARSGGRPFDGLRPALERAHKISESWAEQFPDVEAGLLFTGPPGVGKTHLSVSILRRILVERKINSNALFCDYRSLLREIKGSYHPDTQVTEMDVLQPVLSAEPLVLDDLGGENPTLWVLDTFFYILNRRYNENKLTIITTNYSDPTATTQRPNNSSNRPVRMGGMNNTEDTLSDRITVRLRSRLYEMCRDVRIEGDDYRQSTVQANFLS